MGHIVLCPFTVHHLGMDPFDATPSIADVAGYSRLQVSHCGAIVEFPFRFLPHRPLRQMRFRCARCGVSLSAAEAGAAWTWDGAANKLGDGPQPIRWDEISA